MRLLWCVIGLGYGAGLFALGAPLVADIPPILLVGAGVALVVALVAFVVLAFRLTRRPARRPSGGGTPRTAAEQQQEAGQATRYGIAVQPTQPLTATAPSAPPAAPSLPPPTPIRRPAPERPLPARPAAHNLADFSTLPDGMDDEVEDFDRLRQDLRESSHALRWYHTQKRAHPETPPHLVATAPETTPYTSVHHRPFGSEEEMAAAREQSQTLHVPRSDQRAPRTPKDTHQSKNHGNHPRKRTNRGGGNTRRYA